MLNTSPIASGVVDYDSNIGDAIAKLKSAGIDDVINEFKTQFAQFQADQAK